MAATYDPTDLDPDTASGRRNIVRLLLSDNEPRTGTTLDQPEFDDDEIDYFLDANSDDIYSAAIAAARSAVSKYARASVSRTVGDLSINAESRAAEWRNVIAALQSERAEQSPGLAPLIGQDVTSADYSPVFSLAMHDNPREAETDETSST